MHSISVVKRLIGRRQLNKLQNSKLKSHSYSKMDHIRAAYKHPFSLRDSGDHHHHFEFAVCFAVLCGESVREIGGRPENAAPDVWEAFESRQRCDLSSPAYLNWILHQVASHFMVVVCHKRFPVVSRDLIHTPHAFYAVWLLKAWLQLPQMFSPEGHSVAINLHSCIEQSYYPGFLQL